MTQVSIIIPAFQAQDYIKKSIESCLNQSVESIEVIVVNDGSTDDTLKIINFIKDPRVKLIDKVNEGVGKARNDGLKIASGKYAMFLDADDYLPVGALEKMLAPVLDNEIDFVFSGYSIVRQDGLTNVTPNFNKSYNLIDNFYLDNIISSPWAKLFRMDLIQNHNIKFGGFKIMQDSIFNLRYLSVCNQNSFCKLEESIYVYNKLSEGTTAGLSQEKVKVIDESLNYQEKVYKEFYLRLGEEFDQKKIIARRVLLQDLFVARSAQVYPTNRFNLKKLALVLSNPYLKLKSKIEYLFYLFGKAPYSLFLLVIYKLKELKR